MSVLKKMVTGAVAATIAILPVAANAADAGKLSVARASARTANASNQGEEGAGGGGIIVAVLAAAAVAAGIVVVATENDDDSDSN